MQDEDIAFQRAILADPADTTLKLVYADWLQDRADPRAEYVRLQVKLDRRALGSASYLDIQACEKPLRDLARASDPVCVGFMTTLAQPFEPIVFQESEPGHPFTEPVGTRGQLVTFESQYRRADDWSDGLLADLAFLARVEWWACAYGAASCYHTYSILCELPTERNSLLASDVLHALKVADFQSEHIANLNATHIPYPGYHPYTVNDEIHTDFISQYMFNHDTPGAENAGNHGLLKRYVADGHLWYVLLHTGERPCDMVTLLAVGRSPHGNRLVGAITSQVCHNLCD